MIHKNKRESGAALLIVCALSLILAISSYIGIQYGLNSKHSMTEWQGVDSCAVSIGNNIVTTNDIESICNNVQNYLCEDLNEFTESSYSCVDRGIVCDENEICTRTISVTGTNESENSQTNRSTDIELIEENHEIKKVDSALIFLLDYSGSMQGNRINQLKNSFRFFVNASYDLDYAVLIYSSSVIDNSSIGKGLNHDQNALSIVNRNNPSGGTNFVKPIERALDLIRRTEYESYFVLLVSDGSPNEGSEPSVNLVNSRIKSLDPNNCLFPSKDNPCISIYSLGVDNANMSTLNELSGNSNNNNPQEYSFLINSNQTQLAFEAIVSEIMCRIGPIKLSNFNLFNDTQLLEDNIDYYVDNVNNIIKFYDVEPINICTEMVTNNANITIRQKNVKLKPIRQ